MGCNDNPPEHCCNDNPQQEALLADCNASSPASVIHDHNQLFDAQQVDRPRPWQNASMASHPAANSIAAADDTLLAMTQEVCLGSHWQAPAEWFTSWQQR